MATGRVFIGKTGPTIAVLVLCIITLCYGEISVDRPFYLATSEFGVNLHKQLTDGDHGNLVFSPFSVYTALSMTLLGADGITKKELESVLGVSLNENVHRQLNSILTSMLTFSSTLNITIDLANALFYDPSQLKLSDSYVHNFSQYYGETLREIQRPEPERKVNSWVNHTTRGSIPELLETGTITEDTALLLINAIFFEAQWKEMFNRERTFADNFTTLHGSSIEVQAMLDEGRYSIKSFDPLNATVLELPYRGDRFSMFLIVPDSTQELPTLEENLSGELLEAAVTDMPSPTRYLIALPKFEVRIRKKLTEYLKTLGLSSLFDIHSADLLPMMQHPVPGLLSVSTVLHEALIQVSESGTRASAVTVMKVTVKSLPQVFHVNRPFFFILRDKTERQNVFMGRITDPSASSK